MKNIDMNAVRSEREELQNEMKKIKARIDELDSRILDYYKDDLDRATADKKYPCGTFYIENVKIVIPKNVKWDQDKLKSYYDDGATEYVGAKFTVSEKDYEGWSDEVRSWFEAAREVAPGKPRISFTEDE